VHGRRLTLTALAVAGGLLAAACQSGTPVATQLNPSAVAAKPTAVVSYLKISPAPGAKDVNPASGITVTTANGGRITNVTVKSSGDSPVTGALGDGNANWHSTYALPTGSSYRVTATGTDRAGHPVTVTSSFSTPTPSNTFAAEIYEAADATYGVGMPIMLTFSQPITNKAAVERSLQITTSKPVVGAWRWDGNEQLDFRPRDYWPADTTVSFDGHLNGVEGAKGVYGVHDLTQSFTIGQSVIAVASTSIHKTQIYVGGRLAYTWPISTGRATMPTPDGTYLTVQKNNPVRMIGGTKGTPGYYNELVNWAVRFTYSGDYYHSAPWSVVDQGTTNVSHGCVNLPPADAETYYQMAIPGDPITIESSPKSGDWDDGWTEWFLSWSQYLAGSATHQAVEAGPNGSTFVSPSSVGADTGASPLTTSSPGNYFAVLPPRKGTASYGWAEWDEDCWLTCAVGVATEETARITPRVSASASGMSSGAAARAVRRLRVRRTCARRFSLPARLP
jgi:lipoprotein-anchoring transpeptidase ErfK/SrfK